MDAAMFSTTITKKKKDLIRIAAEGIQIQEKFSVQYQLEEKGDQRKPFLFIALPIFFSHSYKCKRV